MANDAADERDAEGGDAAGAGAASRGGAAGGVTDALKQGQDRFVEVWGQMAGAWGISRTMAQVHALLFITGEPLCSDDVMERLEISRGNASMSLRALLDWGIIERVHRRGDRKEYFKAEQDVWAMFRAIVRERTKREVDPLLAALHEIRDVTGPRKVGANPPSEITAALKAHHGRLDDLVSFFETVEKVSGAFVSPAGRGLQIAASLLTRLGPGGGAGGGASGGAGGGSSGDGGTPRDPTAG
jgi:DNA-binding transcriptional regulator GbsR (MarR family)